MLLIRDVVMLVCFPIGLVQLVKERLDLTGHQDLPVHPPPPQVKDIIKFYL
jgi:hypothetical protein